MSDITERLARIHRLDRGGQEDVAREAAETIRTLRSTLVEVKLQCGSLPPWRHGFIDAALRAGTGEGSAPAADAGGGEGGK